jgi:phage-related protein
MLGVTFGDKHSFHELGLWLKKYPEITPPVPKTKYVEVMGMDGALNLSKVQTGHMQYHRRTITMEFSILDERETWPEKHSDIMDLLHGQDMDLILDDDPLFCYTGTLSVSGFDPQRVTSAVTIVMDAKPYKTRIEKTTQSFTVSGSLTATIYGSRKPVIPTITASSAMQMTFGGAAYSLAAGENVLDDVIIRSGENTFVFNGSGTVAFEYREGRF